MARQLFRQEAIDFQRGQREFGELALLQPVSSRSLAWLLVAAVAIAIAFLSFAQFSRKQTVPGFLVPAAGTLKVFPTREGVVTALYVKEGARVRAGDPLFAVATPEIAADGEDVNAANLAALRQQKKSLLTQIATERQNAASQRERLNAVIASTQQQITDLRSETDIQNQRIRLAGGLVTAAQELLTKGYMSVVETKRREDLLMEQKQNLVSISRQLAETENKLLEAQYSLKQLPIATARKIHPLHDQILEIERRIADGKAHTAYVVRAPGGGRVSTLQVARGQTVQPQHVQLEIVPDRSPLQAELLIPTRAAGFVRPGQPVRFLYEAFPYQNYGSYAGHIVEVSGSALPGRQVSGPMQPKEPVYRAIAALDQPDVEAHGRKAALRSGMLLKAEIILDRRSLAMWILDPLLHKRM